jgi:hypothetical protein
MPMEAEHHVKVSSMTTHVGPLTSHMPCSLDS